MPGIVSYGAYIPTTRLPLALASGRPAREGGPERSVAWSDEDSLTMGVSAAVNCLRGFERSSVDAVFFASTSYAFQEKQASSLLAKALDLRRDVRTGDYSGSLRAGSHALCGAADAVRAGSARCVLVVASECRLAAPGSALERNLGDGAAAFLVGETDVIASFAEVYTLADEIVDVWRAAGDRFVHSWEERFVVQEGYVPNLLEAAAGLLGKMDARIGDFARVAFYGPDARSHATVARRLELKESQVEDPLFGRLGNTGAAFAPLLLASALETAKPGDWLMLCSYGDGAEAIALEVGEPALELEERRGVSWHLARRRPVASYARYLKARDLDPKEYADVGGPGLSASLHHRERDEDIAFRGQRCRRCQTVQFPIQRVCESCFARDDFELKRLSDQTGRIITFTFDHFFPTPDPPTIVTVTEVEGGARVHLQLVDATPEQTRIDLPVEFVFRRIHTAGGRPNYYWKATPLS